MKLIMENWKKFLAEAKKYICPPATQDLELNTKNRNAAIEAEHIQYGPLNLEDESYWDRAAHHQTCLLYTSPSPRDRQKTRMPSSA